MIPRLALLALLAACAAPSTVPPQRTEEDQRKYDEAVARGEVKIGMTKGEVERAWGRPMRTDTTRYRRREVTRWNYFTAEVYFDRDGYVVGFAGY